MSYPLRAWVEGHYACDCGLPQDANPYRNSADMAHAWNDGWLSRERMSRHSAERPH